MMTTQQAPLVSVIIPCYNQAHYLGEAIESVLRQTYTRYEIVVVDDGSSDNTLEVAAGYRDVRLVRQENRGLPAARNAGFRASHGDYVVFLDSDDRLLAEALAAGLSCFSRHPECAFVFGGYVLISANGAFVEGPTLPRVETDYYLALLFFNHIPVTGAVIYRRAMLEAVGGFSTDANIRGAEDYDIYLSLARRFPVRCHNTVVADYRKHASSMSRNSFMMLRSALTVCHTQLPYIKGNKRYEQIYKRGVREHWTYYTNVIVNDIRCHVRVRGEHTQALRKGALLLYYNPRAFAKHAARKLYCMAFKVKSDFAS